MCQASHHQMRHSNRQSSHRQSCHHRQVTLVRATLCPIRCRSHWHWCLMLPIKRHQTSSSSWSIAPQSSETRLAMVPFNRWSKRRHASNDDIWENVMMLLMSERSGWNLHQLWNKSRGLESDPPDPEWKGPQQNMPHDVCDCGKGLLECHHEAIRFHM